MTDRQRPAQILPPVRQRAPRHCEAAGCFASTREGKPYCTQHIDQHPYVADLLAKWAGRDEDDANAALHYDKRKGRVNLQSITAQEILMHLSVNGQRTIERLCRELNVEIKALKGYLRALKRAGVVTEGRSKRGATVIKLVEPNEGEVA